MILISLTPYSALSLTRPLEAQIAPVQHVEAVTGWVGTRNNAADDIKAREDRLRRNVATIAQTAPARLRIEMNLEPPPLARAGQIYA